MAEGATALPQGAARTAPGPNCVPRRRGREFATRTDFAQALDMRPSTSVVLYFGLLCATPSQAEPNLVVIASGGCDDFNLLSGGRLLQASLVDRLGDQVIGHPQLVERFGPPPAHTVEEIQAQLDSARVHYYASDHLKARAKVEDALGELHKLPPGPHNWAMVASANLLYGMVLRQSGEAQGAINAFTRVLRLAPEFQLDPDYYPPGVRTDFDRIRERLQHAAKVRLEIRSNPSGADVFIDGLSKGTTPLALELLPGTYQVMLAKGAAISRPHSVRLERPESVHVDLDFEGRIHLDEILCLSETLGEPTSVLGTIKLTTLAGAEHAVVARLQGSAGRQNWFRASLVSAQTGVEIREAAFALEGSAPASESLEQLSDFIVTGQARGAIVIVNSTEPNSLPWVPPPNPGLTSTPDSGNALRISSYASFGVGAAAATSALVLLLVNKADLNRLKRYEKPDGNLVDDPNVPRLVHAIDDRRSAATGLVVASGVAIASGVVFYFLALKKEYPRMQVSVEVTRAGGLLSVGAGF